jgi:hypothetical protein
MTREDHIILPHHENSSNTTRSALVPHCLRSALHTLQLLNTANLKTEKCIRIAFGALLAQPNEKNKRDRAILTCVPALLRCQPAVSRSFPSCCSDMPCLSPVCKAPACKAQAWKAPARKAQTCKAPARKAQTCKAPARKAPALLCVGLHVELHIMLV